MKNFLYGTTALATAGLIAGVAGNAAAADRINIGVHGYHQQFLVYADQDYKNNGLTGAEKSTNDFDEKHNSEICFVGQTTLDNGITFGVNVQLEGNTSGDQIDESYLFVQSDSLGQIIMGDENNAGYLLHVTAPNGGISLDSGDVISDGFFVNPGLNLFNTASGTTNLRFQDNDSGKITYISPRFAGFQLGVSFIPQFEGGGDNNSSLKLNNGNGANINNGWAGGANYTEDFNGFGVQLSLGALWGDNGADSVTGENDDLFAYNGGAQFSYAGFSFGGAYVRGQGGGGGTTDLRSNSRGWTVGGAYEIGPYTIGIDYQWGQQNQDSNEGKGNLKQGIVSGSYQLGPGIRLVGGVFAFKGRNEDSSEKNKGWGAVTGFKLGF
jgi:predicted porin